MEAAPLPDDALLGYSDRLSVAPGEPIRFFVSSPAPEYDVSLVRLIHGDPNPAGPGFKEELVRSAIDGRHPGRVQPLQSGSHVLVPHAPELCPAGSFSVAVWLCPTAPRLGVQGLVTKLDAGHGWGVLLGPGGAALRIDSSEVGTRVPLLPWEWYLLVCMMNAVSGTVRLVQRPARRLVGAGVELEQRCPTAPTATSTPLVIAGWWSGDHVAGHYNGRLEVPRLWDRTLSAAEVDALFSDGPVPDDAVADWDFSLDIPTAHVADVSGHEHHGQAVNMPMRGVTGRCWTGVEQDWRRVPSEYGAIHFHDDDLSDAGWDARLRAASPRSAERRLCRPRPGRRGRGSSPVLRLPAARHGHGDDRLPGADAQLPGLRQRALLLVTDLRDVGAGERARAAHLA